MSQGLIQGSMREAPLPDIIQLIGQGGKSGCFHVIDEPKRAKIFIKDGRMIHAVSRNAEGLEAVYEVALWLDGRYSFEEGDFGVEVSITRSTPAVLMEMHRRMDEWRVISQKITSLDLYPASTLLPGESVRGVNPKQAKLLKVLTGWYTISELAQALNRPVLTVAKDLYDLVMTGYVVMKGIRSGKTPDIPSELLPKGAHGGPVPAAVSVTATQSPFAVTEPTHAQPNSGGDAIHNQNKDNAFPSQSFAIAEQPTMVAHDPNQEPKTPLSGQVSHRPGAPAHSAVPLPVMPMAHPEPPPQSPTPSPISAETPRSAGAPRLMGTQPMPTQAPIRPGFGGNTASDVPPAAGVAGSGYHIETDSGKMMDPAKIQKLLAFSQRISVTAERALPQSLQPMVEACLVQTMRQINDGGGPDAVKNMALNLSKKAVEAGCDADTVKILNTQLKALFSRSG